MRIRYLLPSRGPEATSGADGLPPIIPARPVRFALMLALTVLLTLALPSRLAAVETYQSVGNYAIPSAFGATIIIGLENVDEQVRLFGLAGSSSSPLYTPEDGLSFSSIGGYPPAIRFTSYGVMDAVRGTSQVAMVSSASTQSPRLFLYDLATQQNTAALTDLPTGTFIRSVTMDSSGNAFMLSVDSNGLGTVRRYSNLSLSTTGTISSAASFTLPGFSQVGANQNMTLGPDGMLYFLQQTANKVARYDPSGTLLGSFDLSGIGYASTVGPNGTIYVAEIVGSQLFLDGYSPSGELLGRGEMNGTDASLTIKAQASMLTVDDQGYAYFTYGQKPANVQVFSTVPEPAATGMLALGLCLGAVLWRRRK